MNMSPACLQGRGAMPVLKTALCRHLALHVSLKNNVRGSILLSNWSGRVLGCKLLVIQREAVPLKGSDSHL